MNSQPQASKAAKRGFAPVVFCDFDGTVTQLDVTDQILTQLAHPSWREIEREWVLGLIGSRECLERQIALVDAPPEELQAVIDSIAIDPHFAAFCWFTRRWRMPLYILSDGFDYVIRRVLKRAGVAGPFRNGSHLFASALRVEGRRLLPSFPHSADPCEHGCATCKATIIRHRSEGRQPIVFVGDGMSDRFAVEAADLVFAKRQLLAHCRESGIACHRFETFKDVQGALEKLLAPAPARRCRQPAVTLS
jgi:2-hydroxy-3-keto-5-methylthiopentenyl-1-phosphate phosphatase